MSVRDGRDVCVGEGWDAIIFLGLDVSDPGRATQPFCPSNETTACSLAKTGPQNSKNTIQTLVHDNAATIIALPPFRHH